MAEAIAVEVVDNIISKLGSSAFKKILIAKDLDSHIERLRDIESYMAAALLRMDPFETSNDVEGCKIERLRRIHEKLVAFFDELETRAKQKEVMGSNKITAKVRSILPSFTVAKKVNALTTELRNIASDYALTSSIVTNSSRNQNQCTSSVEDTGPFPDIGVLIGRDKDKEKIINMLCNFSNGPVSPSVVAIVGVGGQGKTTLAQYVCKDRRVKRSFDKLIWVFVASNSSVREILEKIIASATREKPCNCSKEQLQHLSLQVIIEKKCLIVLDNVWYHDSLSTDWLDCRTLLEEGGFGASGSKFLITTRNRRAAKIMGVHAPYVLHDLAENDSWILLRYFAMRQEEQEKESGVEEIGKEIAKICPKLPLVLKVIGLQLAEMDTTTQWENFMKKLASTPTSYMQDKIMRTLKLCYDQVHDENFKRCIAYCSLFPKGYEYSTDYMARLWMALGFIKPEDRISVESIGEECVVKMSNLGFFEQGYNFKSFKIHDVMHDLISLIGKPMHQMINSETKEIAEGVRYVSLDLANLDWRVFLKFKGKLDLQSIILVLAQGKHGSIPVPLRSGLDKLISICQKLKALEVYRQEIEKVPSSIGEMAHLRYLNLSNNPLQKLPNSITQLVNLLSLKVECCPNLQELPKDIHKMEKLRELKIRGSIFFTNSKERGTLSHMPKGIGKLTNLETLDCFVVFGEDKSKLSNSKASGAAKLEELGCLNNLRGDLWITVNGESKHIVSEAKLAKLENKTDLTGLIIEFKNSAKEDELFLEGLQPHGKNMKIIIIINYGGKKLPSWMRDAQFCDRFPKLGRFEFYYDDKYQFWKSFPCINNLLIHPNDKEYVILIRMRNVVGHDGMLGWVPGYSRLKEQSRFGPVEIELTSVTRNGIKNFTLHSLRIEKRIAQPLLGLNLERSFLNIHKMKLFEMLELEVIPDQFRYLSSLKWLRIIRCRKLKAIPDWIHSLTSLVELYVEECPNLELLPHQIGSLTSLVSLNIEGCPKLESLPHQIGNLPDSCSIIIIDCSKALLKKCEKPTGEYWPLIQHLRFIYITSCEGGEIEHYNKPSCTVNTTSLISLPSNVVPTPLTSDTSPSLPNTTSFKPNLLLILAFAMLIFVCVFGVRLF